ALGLEAMRTALKDRAPTLLAHFDESASAVPEARREQAQWKDLVDDLNSLAEEAIGINFSALCTGRTPRPYNAECPFNGMRPFDYKRRAYFKGREPLVAELAARLRAENVLAVIGPSGSGKSSLVLAGVLPSLGLSESDFAIFSPGADPLGALNE